MELKWWKSLKLLSKYCCKTNIIFIIHCGESWWCLSNTPSFMLATIWCLAWVPGWIAIAMKGKWTMSWASLTRLRQQTTSLSAHSIESTNNNCSYLLQQPSTKLSDNLLHCPPPPSGLADPPQLIFWCLKPRQEFVKIIPIEVSHYYGWFTLIYFNYKTTIILSFILSEETIHRVALVIIDILRRREGMLMLIIEGRISRWRPQVRWNRTTISSIG